MKAVLRSLALTLVAASSPLFAQTTINFDDGTQSGSIGGFYAGLGVTFTNARWDNFVSPNEGSVGAGGLKMIHQTLFYTPKVNNPIIADFSSAVSLISIRGLNVRELGARIDALDIGGNIIGSAQAFGVGLGVDNHPLLEIAAANIRSVRFYQPVAGSSEGMLWDNLSFRSTTVVPEPSTYALVGTGLIGLGVVARRRRA